jgi:hypothetical protein
MAPTKSTDRLETLKKLQWPAYGLLLGTALIVSAKDKFTSAFSNFSSGNYVLPLLQVVLLVVVIIWMIGWIQATSHEFQLCRENLTHFPAIRGGAYYVPWFLAVTLGVLGYFSDKIVVFASIFVVTNLLDFWGNWLFQQHFEEALRLSRMALSKSSEPKDRKRQCAPAHAALEEYYLHRPLLPRIVTMMFLSFGCLILAVVGQMSSSHIYSFEFTCAAYITMIINIVGAIVVISIWRSRRDRKIRLSMGAP